MKMFDGFIIETFYSLPIDLNVTHNFRTIVFILNVCLLFILDILFLPSLKILSFTFHMTFLRVE